MEYKARIQEQLLCNECEKGLIIIYNKDQKDFYYVCPSNSVSTGGVCKQSGVKFKIPVRTLDLELYQS